MLLELWSKLTKRQKTALLTLFVGLLLLLADSHFDSVFEDARQVNYVQVSETSQSTGSNQQKGSTGLYEVLSVTDGDTFRVIYDGKSMPVRLIGIDSPEINHPSQPKECYAQEASDYLKKLLLGKSVALEADPKSGDKDVYSRLLRYAFLDDGTNVGELLIKEGYVLEHTYSVGYKYESLYKSAQLEAQNKKVGFWSESGCNGNLNANY